MVENSLVNPAITLANTRETPIYSGRSSGFGFWSSRQKLTEREQTDFAFGHFKLEAFS